MFNLSKLKTEKIIAKCAQIAQIPNWNNGFWLYFGLGLQILLSIFTNSALQTKNRNKKATLSWDRQVYQSMRLDKGNTTVPLNSVDHPQVKRYLQKSISVKKRSLRTWWLLEAKPLPSPQIRAKYVMVPLLGRTWRNPLNKATWKTYCFYFI